MIIQKKFVNQFGDEGIIWYLESCELNNEDLYRKLWQMRESGWFKNVKGFLIGRTWTEELRDKEEMEVFTYKEALEKSIGILNVPIIYNVDIGHVPPQMTIINGSLAEFTFTNECGELKQEMI